MLYLLPQTLTSDNLQTSSTVSFGPRLSITERLNYRITIIHLSQRHNAMSSSDIFLGLIAILFPPMAVWVKSGLCSADSLINILLCCLGYIPGLLHAWYIIAKNPDPCSDYAELPQDAENGRVTYVYVQGGPGPAGRQQRGPVKHSAGTPLAGYGAIAPMAPPVHQEQDGTWAGGPGEGSSSGPAPPPYEQAVAQPGDHKIQTRA